MNPQFKTVTLSPASGCISSFGDSSMTFYLQTLSKMDGEASTCPIKFELAPRKLLVSPDPDLFAQFKSVRGHDKQRSKVKLELNLWLRAAEINLPKHYVLSPLLSTKYALY